MNHIDKELFNQEGVTRRLSHLSGWYFGCALFGIVSTSVYLLFPNMPAALSALLLLGLVIGDFFLLITLCYYLFGDRYQAFDKANGVFLDRTADYYPANMRPQLEAALGSGSLAALDAVKRGASTDLLVVRYSNEASHSAFCQLLDSKGSKSLPISDICRLA